MSAISSRIRQWCPSCERATLSKLDQYGNTVCTGCGRDGVDDDEEDW